MAWSTFHHRSSYECGECKEGSVHLTLTITTIFCRCQQHDQLPPVSKPIQLKKTPLQNVQKMFQRKLYNNYVFCVVYCLLCCVLFVVYHSTVLCQQSNAKKSFKGNYITTMYFVLCIVCCVVYCLLCITVLCCANNQMHIFSTKLLFFS